MNIFYDIAIQLIHFEVKVNLVSRLKTSSYKFQIILYPSCFLFLAVSFHLPFLLSLTIEKVMC